MIKLRNDKNRCICNAVGAKKAYGKTCFSCGKEGHFSHARNCPAKGRKCSKCEKYGHFARCCKSGFKQHSAQTKPSKQPPVHYRGLEKPTLLMKLHSRVKIIHLLLL